MDLKTGPGLKAPDKRTQQKMMQDKRVLIKE